MQATRDVLRSRPRGPAGCGASAWDGGGGGVWQGQVVSVNTTSPVHSVPPHRVSCEVPDRGGVVGSTPFPTDSNLAQDFFNPGK